MNIKSEITPITHKCYQKLTVILMIKPLYLNVKIQLYSLIIIIIIK